MDFKIIVTLIFQANATGSMQPSKYICSIEKLHAVTIRICIPLDWQIASHCSQATNQSTFTMGRQHSYCDYSAGSSWNYKCY